MTNIDRRTLLRAAAVVSAGAATAGLTGCGSGSSGGGGGNGSLSVLTPVFATPEGKKVLEGSVTEVYRGKHPKAGVRVDYSTWDVLPEKISTSLAGGTLADVVVVGFGWVPPFAAKNTFAELPASLRSGPHYLDQVVAPGRYLDKTYALPLGVDAMVVAYRKDHFEKAGIKRTPRSFQELRAAAKELTRRKSGGGFERVGIDVTAANLRQQWVAALDACGGRMFDTDGTKVLFDSDQGAQALDFLAGFVKDGSSSLAFRASQGLPLETLRKGTSSISLTAASAIGQNAVLPEGRKDLENIGYFLLEERKPTMFVGGALVTVNKRARDPQAAFDFLGALTAEDESLAVAEPNGYLPPFADAAVGKAIRNPAAPLIRDSFRYSVSEGGSPAWMEIRETINPAIEAVLTGKQSTRQALTSIRKQAEDAIGRI
ncbi:extracellular solute-binding protein [Streptomyces sp. NPDC058459]|uniref:extracellular solute-binding protein n=1 Tax=Streptomyces sp. NPDC058459 TaxID=3346508 RepID=UPI0036603AB7